VLSAAARVIAITNEFFIVPPRFCCPQIEDCVSQSWKAYARGAQAFADARAARGVTVRALRGIRNRPLLMPAANRDARARRNDQILMPISIERGCTANLAALHTEESSSGEVDCEVRKLVFEHFQVPATSTTLHRPAITPVAAALLIQPAFM
jgi:hypothetical protein